MLAESLKSRHRDTIQTVIFIFFTAIYSYDPHIMHIARSGARMSSYWYQIGQLKSGVFRQPRTDDHEDTERGFPVIWLVFWEASLMGSRRNQYHYQQVEDSHWTALALPGT